MYKTILQKSSAFGVNSESVFFLCIVYLVVLHERLKILKRQVPLILKRHAKRE